MKEFNNLTDIVFEILTRSETARNDDAELYVMVCDKINPEASNRPFNEVMRHRKEYGLPNYETVSRVRRKVQENNDFIKSSKKVLDGKYEKFKKVREWALNE